MRTYYINNLTGDDRNTGQTKEKSWKTIDRVNKETFLPGDRILFRAGGSWKGMLCPTGSGSSGQPIIVDKYDDETGQSKEAKDEEQQEAGGREQKRKEDGAENHQIETGQIENQQSANPLIAGDGAEAAIKLDGLSYWTIRNIKVTNHAEERALRSGIAVYGKAGTITSGIRIESCEVFDVTGENRRNLEIYQSMYWNSGIYISIPGRSTTASHLHDVVIVDNYVHDVLTSGIRVNQQEDFINDIYHTGVVVQGNTIRRTGTDGIIVANCISPIIEHNRCFDAGALGTLKDTRLIAGIWVCGTSDALIQYNEVARTRLFENDGTAFDTDWGNAGTIIFQHNYTHDNEGGFWLDCAGLNHNSRYVQTILRNNVSVNDRRCIVQADSGLPALFENNLFYQYEAAVDICDQADGRSHCYNSNTFYFPDTPPNGWKASKFENNRYYPCEPNPADRLATIAELIMSDTLPEKEELDGKEESWRLSWNRETGK